MEEHMDPRKESRFNRGMVCGVLTTLIGLGGALHFDSILAGLGCAGIIFILFVIEHKVINPL